MKSLIKIATVFNLPVLLLLFFFSVATTGSVYGDNGLPYGDTLDFDTSGPGDISTGFPLGDENDIIFNPGGLPVDINFFDPDDLEALLGDINFAPNINWDPNLIWSPADQWSPNLPWEVSQPWQPPTDMPWSPGQKWDTDAPSIIQWIENGIINKDGYNADTLNDVTISDGVKVNNVGGVISGVVIGKDDIVDGGILNGKIIGDASSYIINAVVDAEELVGVTLGLGSVVTEKTAFNNPGLNLKYTITELSGYMNPAYPIFQDAEGKALSLINMTADAMNELLSDTTAKASLDETGVFTFSSANMGPYVMPSSIISAITSNTGNVFMPSFSGDMLVTRNGIEFKIAPASFDFSSFLAGLDSLGISYTVDNSGIVFMTFPNGQTEVRRFTTFAFKEPEKKNAFAAGTASFDFSSGDPTLDVYKTLITYPDSVTQTMVPFIHDMETFDYLVAAFGFGYSVDADSGIISILVNGQVIIRCIPEVALTPLSTDSPVKTLMEAGDLNADGISDFYFYSETYRQALFMLP